MDAFISLIGIAIVLMGIFLPIFISKNGVKKPSVPAIVLGVVIAVLGFSFEIVPTGYTGVRTTFGQISETTVAQGFNFKIPFIQEIKLVNNKQQDITIDTQIWGETVEKTTVYASDVTVTYRINKTKSAWIYANVSDSDNNLISQSLVSSSIKSAMVELKANEVTIRSQIEPKIQEKLTASLNEKYGEDTVILLKVVVNNMDFEDSYNEAIAAKSIAQQTYEKQQIENTTAIEKAEADKKVAITKAEADGEATRIAAQAEADALLIASKAEAEANEMLNASLTDAVLKAKFYEKWDGVLPKVTSNGSVITDIGSLVE